jgi:hypothetical protein
MFGRKKSNEVQLMEIGNALADILEVQLVLAPDTLPEDADGKINGKALGYIYGFIDADLQHRRLDILDSAVGIPIIFRVIEHLFPDKGHRYTAFLVDHVGREADVVVGVMTGGQEYIKLMKRAKDGPVPLGLARMLNGIDP